MKGNPTYFCKKCGYICTIKSEKELQDHKAKHAEKCDGSLEHARGKCLTIALKNMIDHPNWSFCYSTLPARIKGQRFLHSWNESMGRVVSEGGEFKIKTNPSKLNEEDFVFDSTEMIGYAGPKERYYRIMKVDKNKVKRLTLAQILEKIMECLKNKQDIWGWIT